MRIVANIDVDAVRAQRFDVVVVAEESRAGIAAVRETVEASVVAPLEDSFLKREILNYKCYSLSWSEL